VGEKGLSILPFGAFRIRPENELYLLLAGVKGEFA
jgi:hypothetical protein